MDGNGRWAKQRFRPRVWGHVRGAQRVSEIVTAASDLNLNSVTMYAFSTENWSRPTDEVTNLFKLLRKFLQKEKKNIIEKNIQFDVIGNYKILDSKIVNLIEEIKDESAANTGLKFFLAINYGGRAEIVDAVNKFLRENPLRELNESDITDNLYNSSNAEVDLLIRTSGDQRVSNFLLWQLCYSEFYFTDTKWPDFTADEFKKIILDVSNRERRFGGVNKSGSLKSQKLLAKANQKTMN